MRGGRIICMYIGICFSFLSNIVLFYDKKGLSEV